MSKMLVADVEDAVFELKGVRDLLEAFASLPSGHEGMSPEAACLLHGRLDDVVERLCKAVQDCQQ